MTREETEDLNEAVADMWVAGLCLLMAIETARATLALSSPAVTFGAVLP